VWVNGACVDRIWVDVRDVWSQVMGCRALVKEAGRASLMHLSVRAGVRVHVYIQDKCLQSFVGAVCKDTSSVWRP